MSEDVSNLSELARRRRSYPFGPLRVVPLDFRPGAVNKISEVPMPAIDLRACESRDRPIDCSAGDRPRVIISDTTAILLAEAFCDMANARRLYVTGIEGAENFTRAFGELELLDKALKDRKDGVDR